MSFRPDKGRAPYIAAGGGSVVTSMLVHSQTFYPEQISTTGTAVLADLAFGTLGLLNVYNMSNNECSIFSQGQFHPFYNGGNVTFRVAFHCPNANPVGLRTIEIGIRAWNVAGGSLLDQAIAKTAVSLANTLPGNIVLYFPDVTIAPQGTPAALAHFEWWIDRTDDIANSIYISAVQMRYTLSKKVF